ncbi:MAG: 30S ribosomal protein S24e [Desulfurococcales archaeon]|nr:30S ribosomal protein S24e [Desulfurococcales archaeon]
MSEQVGKQIQLGEGVTANVVKEVYNPLIGKKKLYLVVNHPGQGTPMRFSIRMAVAEAYSVDMKRVYVKSIRTEYGKTESHVIVNIYDTVERALKFESKHIIDRNGGLEGFEE